MLSARIKTSTQQEHRYFGGVCWQIAKKDITLINGHKEKVTQNITNYPIQMAHIDASYNRTLLHKQFLKKCSKTPIEQKN